MSKRDVKKVEKPWGHELIWAQTGDYVGKIIFIKKGQRLSLQFHEVKEETIYVMSGVMSFHFEENGVLSETVLKAGEAHHIPPMRKHRMTAVEDCTVLEVSTPQLGDVVRIEDAYGRAGTNAP